MAISPALIKVAVLAGAALVGFGGGWTANGWRLDGKLAKQAADHSQAVTKSYADGMANQARLQAEKDARTGAVAVIDVDELAKLRKAQDENETLRGRVAAGAVRLRVAAVCPAAGPNVPASGPAASVDTGAGATLTADAGQNYIALRSGIALTERTLAACQRAAAVLTGQTPATTAPATP